MPSRLVLRLHEDLEVVDGLDDGLVEGLFPSAARRDERFRSGGDAEPARRTDPPDHATAH